MKKLLILLLLTACAEHPTTVSPELYITSYHTRDTTPVGKKYNEFNPGVGVHVTQDMGNFRYGMRAGTFENSFKDQTEVLAGTAEYCVGDQFHACGGAMLGGIHGYNKTQFAQFAAAPTLEVGYERFSVDFTAYPTSDRNAAVLTGWLKYKAWEF